MTETTQQPSLDYRVIDCGLMGGITYPCILSRQRTPESQSILGVLCKPDDLLKPGDVVRTAMAVTQNGLYIDLTVDEIMEQREARGDWSFRPDGPPVFIRVRCRHTFEPPAPTPTKPAAPNS